MLYSKFNQNFLPFIWNFSLIHEKYNVYVYFEKGWCEPEKKRIEVRIWKKIQLRKKKKRKKAIKSGTEKDNKNNTAFRVATKTAYSLTPHSRMI